MERRGSPSHSIYFWASGAPRNWHPIHRHIHFRPAKFILYTSETFAPASPRPLPPPRTPTHPRPPPSPPSLPLPPRTFQRGGARRRRGGRSAPSCARGWGRSGGGRGAAGGEEGPRPRGRRQRWGWGGALARVSTRSASWPRRARWLGRQGRLRPRAAAPLFPLRRPMVGAPRPRRFSET